MSVHLCKLCLQSSSLPTGVELARDDWAKCALCLGLTDLELCKEIAAKAATELEKSMHETSTFLLALNIPVIYDDIEKIMDICR